MKSKQEFQITPIIKYENVKKLFYNWMSFNCPEMKMPIFNNLW
jgi:hypothetical protein